MTKLSDAMKSLVRAKETAEARLAELENERRETKSAIKSLDAAIRALEPPTPKSKPQRNNDDPSNQA